MFVILQEGGYEYGGIEKDFHKSFTPNTKASLPFPYLLLFTLIPHLAHGLFDSSGSECLSRAKHPNASFFPQRTTPSYRAQRNFFA